MIEADPTSTHPVLRLATHARELLTEATSETARPLWALTSEELRTALVDLTTLGHQIETLRLQLLAEAERNGQVADPGDRDTATWLARQTNQTRAVARADKALALALDTDLTTLAAAMTTGHVSPAQARVIKRCLDLLPTTGEFAVSPDQRAHAEAHLVELAATHDPRELEHLGKRIYAVICPDHADAYEGRLLEAEEARAARKVTFEMWEDPQGICHGRFRLPRRYGHALKKALEALMSPARQATGTTNTGTGTTADTSSDPHATSDTDHTADAGNTADADDTDDTGCAAPPPHRDLRPLPVRRGEAFCELLDRITAENLPTTGGYDATLIVTMTHEQLLASLETAGVATLDTGARISAAEA